MSTPSIVVLSAGLGSPSSTRMLADQLADAAAREFSQVTGQHPQVITHELRPLAHDITDSLLSGFASERLGALTQQLREASAIIAVTPIFNLGPNGLFKTFIDGMDREVWREKPLLLGATAGTARHSLVLDLILRPQFQYLKASVVPTVVFAASGDFGAADASESDTPLAERTTRAARELAALTLVSGGAGPRTDTNAASSQPEIGVGLDPEFRDFTPMEDLFGRRP